MHVPRRLLPTFALAVALCLCALSGCGPSDNIRDLAPPPEPQLQDLERHLDYVDPDAGRPNYVVRPNR
jgi:ABC-type oligopeptide transport system substrate-binding subunit